MEKKYYTFLGAEYVYCIGDDAEYKNGKSVESYQMAMEDAKKIYGKSKTHFSFLSYEEADAYRCGKWSEFVIASNISIHTEADAIAFVDGTAKSEDIIDENGKKKKMCNDGAYGILIFYKNQEKPENLTSEDIIDCHEHWNIDAEKEGAKVAVHKCLDMGCKSMELVFDCEQIRLMFKKKQTTIENYFDDGDYELLYHDWDEQETVADRNTVSLAVRHKKTGEEKKIWIRLVKVYSHGARTYVMNETDYPYAVFNDVVDIMAKSLVKIPYAEKNVKDIYNLYRITDDLSENPQSGALFLKVSETESTADRRAKAEYMLEVALGRIHFVWE